MINLKIHKLGNIILILILCILHTIQGQLKSDADLMEAYSPGAYFEEHDVDMYDSVVPILFKFQSPEWVEQIQLRLPINCTTDEFGTGSQFLCPVFSHLQNKVIAELKSVLRLPFSTLQETDMNITFDCDRISLHFRTEKIQNKRFIDYINLLSKCANGKIWESNLIKDYSWPINAAYDKMITKYTQEYFEKLPEADRNKKASELNNKIALSGLLNMHYLAMVKRWRLGTRDCKRGFIPDSLVSEKNLRLALETLEKKITSEKPMYRYTMPYEHSQITRYYNAPIADCVYTMDKFYVRILVPITKVRLSPVKLVNIRSIPFYSSSGGVPQLCMVQGFAKGRLFTTGVEMLGTTGKIGSLTSEVKCDAANFKLCKVPDPQESYVDQATECARMLVTYDNEPSNANDAALSIKCPMECSIITRPETLPFVVRAHDPFDTIYLVMDAEKANGVDLECFNRVVNGTGTQEDTYVVRIPPIKKGALGIVLSCNCRLPLMAHNLLAGSECPNTLVIFKVIAFQDAAANAKIEETNTPAPVANPDDAA